MFDVRLSFQPSEALPLLSGSIGEWLSWVRGEELVMLKPRHVILSSVDRKRGARSSQVRPRLLEVSELRMEHMWK